MYKIDEIKMLRLGQRDENLARSLPFDCSDWLEQYPEASIHILFRRPGESAIVPMSTTLEGTTLTWLIHDYEVGKTGIGNAEFRAVDTAGLRRKSRIIPCSIEETLLGDDETVLYTQDQVDETLAHISEAAQAAQAAKASEEAAALSASEAGESAASAGTAADVAVSARDAAQAAQTAAETAQHQAEAAQSGVHADAEAAEQAKVAAQAAQASAQGAASQASADRTAAESARADAEAAATHAEAVVEGIDQAGADQVAAVNAAGQAQVTAVNQAGTTQVGNVNAAGTTQVSAVQAKGTQVINSIPADYSTLSTDVTNLKSALGLLVTDALPDISGNDIIDFTPGGYIQLNTGVADVTNPNANVNYRYAVIPCNAGDVFNVSATGANAGRAWGFVSATGAVLAMADASVTVSNLRLVAPQNAVYLVINDNNSGVLSYVGEFLVDKVDANTAFRIDVTDNGIKPNQTSFCEPTESDESDVNILSDITIYPGYITATGGVRTQNANYQTTGQMDVIPGSTYKIDLSAGATQVLAVWFDADGVTGTQVNLGFVSANTKTVNAVCPNGKKKLVLNVNSTNAVTAPIGVYNLSPVLSYDKFTIPDLIISVDKPLSGKTICNFGDSLFGQARPPYDVSTKLAELTGATVHNCGFGGCQMGLYSDNAKYDAFSMYRLADAIATGDWTYQDDGISAGGLPAYFAETLALLKTLDWTKIDIITISYGTNDFTNGLQPRISNNPDSGNNKFKAVGTALQYSIETILSAYPNIRIFVCLPMYRVWLTANNEFDYDSNTATHTSWVGSPDGAEHTFIEFVEAERNVAKANQLPIIDNYYDLGINKNDWVEYFPANDGTHHNQNGRNLIAEHMAHVLW